ncbi:hypothetical protein KKD49_01310 [Myxococcota bacterium]|nr:hypothetical protein [Myxococcota bacterium]
MKKHREIGNTKIPHETDSRFFSPFLYKKIKLLEKPDPENPFKRINNTNFMYILADCG